jgi:hypothetical protein
VAHWTAKTDGKEQEMYLITELVGPHARKETIARADSLAGAIFEARARFDIIELEIDALYPTCADFFTADGRVMAIQPEGFSL